MVGKDIIDRLSTVILIGDTEKILVISVLKNSTADEQAEVTYKILIEWNIEKSVRALLFDTTVVNSGRLGGIYVLLKRVLKKKIYFIYYAGIIFYVVFLMKS